MVDQNFPVKRLPNESHKAFEAFNIYLELGRQRTIDKAYRKANNIQNESKRASPQWFNYSRDFNWVERSRDYDDWIFQEKQKEKIRLRKFIIDEVGDRLIKDLKKDLNLSQELTKHLEKFLQRGDMNPLIFKSFCQAHKDIVITRKEIYQSYLDLTGINFLAEKIAEQEKKDG